jgi:hypothetical protein
VHAVLQSLESPALEPDTLDSFAPPLADDFGIALSALIGPSEGEGAEVFYLTVCSPTWLARATMFENSKGFEFIRNRLVVERWDAELIRRAVTDLCLHTSGADWHEVAIKLSRYLYWEFEDYSAR